MNEEKKKMYQERWKGGVNNKYSRVFDKYLCVHYN